MGSVLCSRLQSRKNFIGFVRACQAFRSALLPHFVSVSGWHFYKWRSWLLFEDAALHEGVVQNISPFRWYLILVLEYLILVCPPASQCASAAVYPLFFLATQRLLAWKGGENVTTLSLLCHHGEWLAPAAVPKNKYFSQIRIWDALSL